MKIVAVFFLFVAVFSNQLMAVQAENIAPADLRGQLVMQKKEFLRLAHGIEPSAGFEPSAGLGAADGQNQLIPGVALNAAVAKILFRSASSKTGFLGMDLPIAFIPGVGKKENEAMDLAIAYLEYGLFDESLQRFSELVKSSYSEQLSDAAHYYQAIAYQEIGQYTAAENVLRQACPVIEKRRVNISRRCHDRRAPLLLVELLVKQQRLKEAAKLLPGLKDTSSVYVKTAFSLYSAQYRSLQFDAARRGLEQLSQIDSSDPETHRYQDRINIFLGYDYLDRGLYLLAKDTFHSVNLHTEKASQALLGLGMAEWFLGKEQAALKFWQGIEKTPVRLPLMRSAALMIAYAQWQLGLEKKASATYRDAIARLRKENSQIKRLRRTINNRNLQSLLPRNRNVGATVNARDSVAESLKKYLNRLYLNQQFATLMSDYKELMDLSGYVAAVIAMPALSRHDSLSLDGFVSLQKNIFQLRVIYEQQFRRYLNAEFDAQQKMIDADLVQANYFQARLIDSMLSLGNKK